MQTLPNPTSPPLRLAVSWAVRLGLLAILFVIPLVAYR